MSVSSDDPLSLRHPILSLAILSITYLPPTYETGNRLMTYLSDISAPSGPSSAKKSLSPSRRILSVTSNFKSIQDELPNLGATLMPPGQRGTSYEKRIRTVTQVCSNPDLEHVNRVENEVLRRSSLPPKDDLPSVSADEVQNSSES
ncbi:hypothetical protein EVAR_64663_1 [Eumeta japonica]|uniref:Uncharacterized protein n=1 Tax=Eumeta variegata TaxID=151549 RepID=A0A4C2A526_EUMVA|nr:hypothetical protein EVAR_64663_1 [Eumeta japonica]